MLEEKILTIHEETLQEHNMKPVEMLELWVDSSSEIYGAKPSWKSIDSEDLLELPSYIYDGSHHDVQPEWTYVIDLDREVFGVESVGCEVMGFQLVGSTPPIWFHFREIPRDRWSSVFKYDEKGDLLEVCFSFDECPEAFESLKPPRYFATEKEQNACHERYREYSCLSLDVIANAGNESIIPPGEFLGLMIFDSLAHTLNYDFEHYLTSMSHESPGFQEVAFAVLSLAAGHFYLERPDRLY